MHHLYVTSFLSFFFNHPPPTEIYTLSLHDALPICSVPLITNVPRSVMSGKSPMNTVWLLISPVVVFMNSAVTKSGARSEEHTSELQSRRDLVCRLLLEKKNKNEECQVVRSSCVKYD